MFVVGFDVVLIGFLVLVILVLFVGVKMVF